MKIVTTRLLGRALTFPRREQYWFENRVAENPQCLPTILMLLKSLSKAEVKSSKYILWYFKQIQMEMWMEVSSVDFSSSGERGESQLCASGVGLSFPSKCFTWEQLTRIHYSASCASILYNWGIMTQAQRNLHDIVCINLCTSEASWCGYIWVSFSASTFPPSPAHIV